MRWAVETLDVVDDEIMELPPKLQARLRVVALHVFVVKSQKTPRRLLELAKERMKEVKP